MVREDTMGQRWKLEPCLQPPAKILLTAASVVLGEVVKVVRSWIYFEDRAMGPANCPLYQEILQTYLSSLPASGDKFALKYSLPGHDLKNIVRGLGQYQG